jgi:glycosyl-4,4'-diaponeurosporenoate acyltransferase
MDDVLVVVLVDSGVWAAWSALVGYAGHRLPRERLDHDGRLTRMRSWERDGRIYEKVGIRFWKDLLPDAGTVFRGGRSKRALPGRSHDDLRAFAAETRRAELVHWGIPLATPAFALWNPPALFAAMVAYAVVANVPCLLVQRFNRGRILRILGRPRPRVATP